MSQRKLLDDCFLHDKDRLRHGEALAILRERLTPVTAPESVPLAKAVGRVIPELIGKLDGAAVRVPTPNVSLIDMVFVPSRATTDKELSDAIIAAADGPMQGILGYDSIPLVSIDYNHDPRSSIVAIDKINVVDERLVRVMTWYDNEWGFACRMVDTAVAMGRFL